MRQQLVPDPFGAGLSAPPVPRPGPLGQWIAQRQAQPDIAQRAMQERLLAGRMPSLSDAFAALPASAAQGAWDFLTLPGDAMAGRVSGDPNDPAFMGRVVNGALSMTGGAGAVPAAGAELGMGIRAYHGSPHNFDGPFRMDRLGTGEGSQVYGHGLYFAENPKVAEHYRDALSRSELSHPQYGTFRTDPDQWQSPNGVSNHYYPWQRMERILQDASRAADPDIAPSLASQISQTITDTMAGFSSITLDELRDSAIKFGAGAPREQAAWLSALNRAAEFKRQSAGKVYEVDINADPSQLLDWDQSLVDQPRPVQEALSQLMPSYEPYTRPESFASASQYMDATGGLPPPSGATAYHTLAQSRAPGKAGEVAASQALRESGIPGIRFLDQGSRGTGAGTRNLVVFDDQIIRVLRKYGMAGLAILPPATAAAVRQYMEPVDDDPFAQ